MVDFGTLLKKSRLDILHTSSSKPPKSLTELKDAMLSRALWVIIVAQSYANGLTLFDNLCHLFPKNMGDRTSDVFRLFNGSKLELISITNPGKLVGRRADIVLVDAVSALPLNVTRALLSLAMPGGQILTHLRNMLKPVDLKALTQTLDSSALTKHDDFDALKSKIAGLYAARGKEREKSEQTEILLGLASSLLEQLEKMQLRNPSKSEFEKIKIKIDGLSAFLRDIPQEIPRRKELYDLVLIAEDLFHKITKGTQ
jgi:hypothetical protein